MARRKKSKRTRRQKRGINLVDALETYIQASIATTNFAGTTPFSFVTGQEFGQIGTTKPSGSMAGSRPQAQMGFAYMPGAMSVTIPELLGVGANTSFGSGTDMLKRNFQANWSNALVQSLITKVSFTVGKKLSSKLRSKINNKVLKPMNLKSVAVV